MLASEAEHVAFLEFLDKGRVANEVKMSSGPSQGFDLNSMPTMVE